VTFTLTNGVFGGGLVWAGQTLSNPDRFWFIVDGNKLDDNGVTLLTP
jgi:hypothetical protein